MNKSPIFFVSLVVFIFILFSMYLVNSASNSTTSSSCNSERLNQIYDLGLSGVTFGGINRSFNGVFLAPSDISYYKLSIINATLSGICTGPNTCDFFVNGAFCGTILTNSTNPSVVKSVYSLNCLPSIRSGTNIISLNLNPSSSFSQANIDKLFLEMEVVPSNC